MDNFTRAYIEAALWASTTSESEPLDADHNIGDIDPESLARMVETCRVWQADHETPEFDSAGCDDDSLSGHCLWLTRNRHGTGFWDRGLGEVGDELSRAAHGLGECILYLGDDKRIYLFNG